MSQSKWKRSTTALLAFVVAMLGIAAAAEAANPQPIRIPLGRAQVVVSDADVKTVAIAEPKIADAAVGSARTVVVNAKAVGRTSLVVYDDAGRFTVYDVDVYVPNAEKQVLLHVKVAEVDDQDGHEYGVDLAGLAHSARPALDGTISGGIFTSKNALLGILPDPLSPADRIAPGSNTDGFVRFVRSDNQRFQASWQALEEKGKLHLLANPTLVARSGEKATFLAGGEFPVPIAQAISGGGTTVTVEWKQFGVNVDFTPTIEENNSITLKVSPEVSQVDYSNAVALNGYTIPGIATRRTDTTVELNSGENLVIGGLKQHDRVRRVRRVPIIGAIPVIGFFFSHTEYTATERELLVVVSPEIVAGSADVPALPTDKDTK